MASLSDVFTEKERTNWLKAWLAVDTAKSGLEQFAENEAKVLHANIYNSVWSSVQAPAVCNGCNTANLLKCPTPGICNKRGANSLCKAMHNTATNQPRPCPASVCNKVLDEIEKQHRFGRPSWKNTTAEQWATNPWQIAKAYLPPDGYIGKSSTQDTDFNGIISFMINCTHFDSKFSFLIYPGNNNPPCLLTKARVIGRTVRHSSQFKLTCTELQDIFTTLTALLTDPQCLVHDLASREAVMKLAKLQNDGLKITQEEMIHALQAVEEIRKEVENTSEKTLDEIRIHTDKCKRELDEKTLDEIRIHTDKCKRELDEHTERRKTALDNNRETNYEQSCEEILKEVANKSEKTLDEIRIHTDKCKRELDEYTERRKTALDENRETSYEPSCEGNKPQAAAALSNEEIAQGQHIHSSAVSVNTSNMNISLPTHPAVAQSQCPGQMNATHGMFFGAVLNVQNMNIYAQPPQ